jgi:hypothetical protein
VDIPAGRSTQMMTVVGTACFMDKDKNNKGRESSRGEHSSLNDLGETLFWLLSRQRTEKFFLYIYSHQGIVLFTRKIRNRKHKIGSLASKETENIR